MSKVLRSRLVRPIKQSLIRSYCKKPARPSLQYYERTRSVPVDKRKISAQSMCVMYTLLVVACAVYVLLGLAPDPYIQESILELPIFVQLVIAEIIGFTPVLVWLDERTHWAVPYALVICTSFWALYRIGWWVERINED